MAHFDWLLSAIFEHMKGFDSMCTEKRKKYFFFDIDNTLSIGITKVVPDDTKKCLERLRAAGHFVSIATGRLQCDALEFARTLSIHTFVADGGNSLTWQGKLLEMTGLPREKCLALINELDRCHLSWAVATKNELIRYTTSPEFAERGRHHYFKTVLGPIDVSAITDFYKIFATRPTPTGPQPNWQELDLIPYLDNTFLIEPTDKASGIRRMIELEGGRIDDVVVFGDGLNDLNMFSPDWFCIAMGNGRPQLKERADYITDDCDKGGIVHACEKFGWI